jgi:hypothetical protein
MATAAAALTLLLRQAKHEQPLSSQAMCWRALIDQALGILMGQWRCG